MKVLLAIVLYINHATLATAAGKTFEVSYRGSTRPGELQLDATYTLWVPDGVARLRGIIVHQHGCGFAANAAGATAAHDLHWQALAKKWDCGLLSPWYKQTEQGRDPCHLWCDPRKGSRQAFLKAIDEFAETTRHAELRTAPWCLWGHSGGAFWASLMQTSDPERIVALWFRSGTAYPSWELGEIAQPTLTDSIYRIPMMLNPGIKERENEKPVAAWLGSLAMFEAYRSRGGLIGFAPDPRSGHDCGDSRYLAIPFFDTCLAMRLPDPSLDAKTLLPADIKQAWLASWQGEHVQAAALYDGKPNDAVWLPNEDFARLWSKYVKDVAMSDLTPPPAPTNVTIALKDDKSVVISWDAEADFESGLQAFIIERDGKSLARVPENPIGKYGRPLFQTLSFHDTPELPLPKMQFTDTTAQENHQHEYRVIAVNSVGINSTATVGQR